MAHKHTIVNSVTTTNTPANGSLLQGELATNIVDQKLWVGDASGDPVILNNVSVTISDTAPSSPLNGDLWWDSDIGNLNIWYEDGSSNQWVSAGKGGSGTSALNDLSDVTIPSPTTGQLIQWSGTAWVSIDVDDTPVDAETTVPISSNWAFDHTADSDAHPVEYTTTYTVGTGKDFVTLQLALDWYFAQTFSKEAYINFTIDDGTHEIDINNVNSLGVLALTGGTLKLTGTSEVGTIITFPTAFNDLAIYLFSSTLLLSTLTIDYTYNGATKLTTSAILVWSNSSLYTSNVTLKDMNINLNDHNYIYGGSLTLDNSRIFVDNFSSANMNSGCVFKNYTGTPAAIHAADGGRIELRSPTFSGNTTDVGIPMGEVQPDGAYIVDGDLGVHLTNPVPQLATAPTVNNAFWGDTGSSNVLKYKDNAGTSSLVLRSSDVDDTPVDAETTVPISSNWAYDHANGADPHTVYPLDTEVLKKDGSVALTANWDVGAYTITGLRFVSDQATGTAPFTVASTTVVTNLNADQVDGNDASDIVLKTDVDDTPVDTATDVPVSSNWAYDHANGADPHTVYPLDTEVGKLGTAREWTTTQNFNGTTLTDGATINWNLQTNQVCKVTLGGNRTFAAPTNFIDGGIYTLEIIQDGTGSRTITWNAVFKFTGGVAPTLTTTASARDIITFKSDGTNLYEIGRSLNPS